MNISLSSLIIRLIAWSAPLALALPHLTISELVVAVIGAVLCIASAERGKSARNGMDVYAASGLGLIGCAAYFFAGIGPALAVDSLVLIYAAMLTGWALLAGQAVIYARRAIRIG